MNASIFDMEGHTITAGLQSGKVCDEARNAAKRLAAERGKSVIVEDYGLCRCYRVTPSGRIWNVPSFWVIPDWDDPTQ